MIKDDWMAHRRLGTMDCTPPFETSTIFSDALFIRHVMRSSGSEDYIFQEQTLTSCSFMKAVIQQH